VRAVRDAVMKVAGVGDSLVSYLIITRDKRMQFERNTKSSESRAHRASCKGSRLPIPAEPAPCHRPWITPQGATPAGMSAGEKIDHLVSLASAS